tara:strand:- start:105 stop:413 length:309 start_codon:yes stop_codon:yes gene_type:complete
MADHRREAYARERRYRMLSKPWVDTIAEIRSERGGLLGSEQFDSLAGVEKAERLDIVDSRLKTAEGWVAYYEKERKRGARFRVRRYLREISSMSDNDLEWET